MSLTMTESEFAFWLERSSPASQVVYHCGSLPRDRFGKNIYDGDTVKQIPTTYSQAVDYTAWAAWRAMQGRYVLLTQRRVNESSFEYRAIRTDVSFPQNLASAQL